MPVTVKPPVPPWDSVCYAHPERVQALLADPACPSVVDGRPLAFAGLQRADPEVLDLCEAAGLPFGGTDPQHANAWHWAAPRRGMIAWLLDRPHLLDRTGLNMLNAQKHTPLQIAMGISSPGGENHEANALLLIAAGSDVQVLTPYGDTLLHLVAGPVLTHTLVAAGLAVDQRSRDGETPLFRAVTNGLTDVVDALLHNGANPGGRAHGIAPLHRAVVAGERDIAIRLVQAGADPWAMDRDGQRPWELAGRWPDLQAAWEAPTLRAVLPVTLDLETPRHRSRL